MNRASRIKLAKELLYCAKMVLDAENRYYQNRTAKTIIADYAYDEFKNFISRYEIAGTKKLIDYLGGIEKASGSGYVIHHFDDAGITHYIEGGKTK